MTTRPTAAASRAASRPAATVRRPSGKFRRAAGGAIGLERPKGASRARPLWLPGRAAFPRRWFARLRAVLLVRGGTKLWSSRKSGMAARSRFAGYTAAGPTAGGSPCPTGSAQAARPLPAKPAVRRPTGPRPTCLGRKSAAWGVRLHGTRRFTEEGREHSRIAGPPQGRFGMFKSEKAIKPQPRFIPRERLGRGVLLEVRRPRSARSRWRGRSLDRPRPWWRACGRPSWPLRNGSA